MKGTQWLQRLEAKFGLIGRNSRARTWAYMADGVQTQSMKRLVVVTTALLVVVAMVGGVGAVSAAAAETGSTQPGQVVAAEDEPNETTAAGNETTTSEPATDTENDSAADIAAGAKLAGVIGAQRAEHESAVQSQAFEKAFENAGTNASKAAVLDRSSERIQERIQTLENETERLEAAFENGTISNDTYQGKMTALTARINALERQANQTTVKSRTIPEHALEARGLNRTDLESLENRTRNATSPRAATVAKRVAGPRVGQPPGPPANTPGNGTPGPADGHGPQSTTGQAGTPQSSQSNGEMQAGTPGQNRTGNGIASTNGSNPTSPGERGVMGQSAANGSNQSNTFSGNASAGQQGWSNDAEHPGQNDTQPGSSGNDHPIFGNSSAIEFVIGLFR